MAEVSKGRGPGVEEGAVGCGLGGEVRDGDVAVLFGVEHEGRRGVFEDVHGDSMSFPSTAGNSSTCGSVSILLSSFGWAPLKRQVT